MGDGLLVLFGYPQAREDDAARLVRAGTAVSRQWQGFGFFTGGCARRDWLKPNLTETANLA
jgi:class 3 adenylate cyclase